MSASLTLFCYSKLLKSQHATVYNSAYSTVNELKIQVYLYAPVNCIPRPAKPGNSRAFNFSIFKALLKALHCGSKFVVKSLLNGLLLNVF